MKSYTLSESEDKLIGIRGTGEREIYEAELKTQLICDMIKKVRKERKLTQEELGNLIGVKKSQISRLENNSKNVTIETILKVFNVMKAEVSFSVHY